MVKGGWVLVEWAWVVVLGEWALEQGRRAYGGVDG